ncbi:MAG TPA: hypothetical protein VEB20_16140, partial [Azospirillaceae bacterium]|nr:hypothetical protein [Azospirillaceae bacterium]
MSPEVLVVRRDDATTVAWEILKLGDGFTVLPSLDPAVIEVAGIGDLTGDGSDELVLLNRETRSVTYLDAAKTEFEVLLQIAPEYRVAAVGRFKPDVPTAQVLLQNRTRGEFAIYDGATHRTDRWSVPVRDLDVAAVIRRDGDTDLLVLVAEGRPAEPYLWDGEVLSLVRKLGPAERVVGAGRFDKEAPRDLLVIHDAASGTYRLDDVLAGAGPVRPVFAGAQGASPVGLVDAGGDGVPDLIVRRADGHRDLVDGATGQANGGIVSVGLDNVLGAARLEGVGRFTAAAAPQAAKPAPLPVAEAAAGLLALAAVAAVAVPALRRRAAAGLRAGLGLAA